MNLMRLSEFIRQLKRILYCAVVRTIVPVFSLCLVQSIGLQAQSFVNVTHNDSIPCQNYVVELVSPPSPPIGEATVAPGGFIEFRPGPGSIPTNIADTVEVTIPYRVTCGTTQKNATLTVKVTMYNNPANIIPQNIECYEQVSGQITFGIRRKYTAAANSANSHTPGNDNGDPLTATANPKS